MTTRPTASMLQVSQGPELFGLFDALFGAESATLDYKVPHDARHSYRFYHCHEVLNTR